MQRSSTASAAGGDSQRVSKTDEVDDVDILQTSPAPGAAAAAAHIAPVVANPNITPQTAASPIATGGQLRRSLLIASVSSTAPLVQGLAAMRTSVTPTHLLNISPVVPVSSSPCSSPLISTHHLTTFFPPSTVTVQTVPRQTNALQSSAVLAHASLAPRLSMESFATHLPFPGPSSFISSSALYPSAGQHVASIQAASSSLLHHHPSSLRSPSHHHHSYAATVAAAAVSAGSSQSASVLAGIKSVVTSPGSISCPVIIGSTSVSPSGGTIHHHGQSPTRGGVLPPLANSQQQQITSLASQQAPTSGQKVAQRRASGSSSAPTSPGASTGSSISRVLFESPKSTGPSPRKKARTEEKPPATQDVADYRKQIVELKLRSMSALKATYCERLTELFFLQNGGNLMEYATWRKRPTPQLLHYIKSGALDSDDEEDPERKINNEVTVLTSSGSNVPIATPVAICKELPASVTALVHQSAESKKLASGGRHGMVFGHVQSSSSHHGGTPSVTKPGGFPITPASTSLPVTPTTVTSVSSVCTATTSITTTTSQSAISTAASTSHMHLLKSLSSTKVSSSPVQHGVAMVPKVPKSGISLQRPSLKQSQLPQSISDVYDTDVGSQEAIVERAKQEAQVMHRVAELRKEGLWTSRRLPKVQELPRNKAQWDYLLEEMTWLAADFAQERKWKKAAARKVARMVQKHFQDLEQKELRAEKEEAQKLRKIASQIAKQIKEFWSNIEKVVQYKMKTRHEEKRKKALDLHLNFIVDQTEKYSTWLTEGLQNSRPGSVGDASSLAGSHKQDQSAASGDEDFEPDASDADDEETIEEAEKEDGHDPLQTEEELAALHQESELPIEELLRSFTHPLSPSDLNQSKADESMDVDSSPEKGAASDGNKDKDSDFIADGEEDEDVEVTMDEQEKRENKKDTTTELNELQEEGELPIEELMKRYAGAYDSDFEFPQDSSSADEEDDDDDDDDDDDAGSESDHEHEDTDEEPVNVEDEDTQDADVMDVGLDYLMNPDEQKNQAEKKVSEESGPGREITDIAAEALSLQPKGYTLQTAEVKTPVPFLVKHVLREYQHVGLDWLATMNEKRLNGILADEMGLGKTIQTIALLGHLACEKGIWGPHLIVVPTSVMLNWEMELKKWCPAFKILTYYGSIKDRKLKRQGWTKTNAFHVCITSYKLVIQDHQSFRRKKWKYLILDEAQNIKNFKSQRWQTLLNFQSQRRLLLTGTPLQNSLMELWSLMHFLMPNVFQSHREFKEWFANPLTGMIEGSHEYNENLIRRLHKVLRPFLLRRLKDDVEKQMPKKYEHVIMCRLSKRQRYLYDDFMSQTRTKETLASGHFLSVINILMQLRKVCNHPNLFEVRPIVSPFQTEGIVYNTASLAAQALDTDSLQSVDIRCLFPNICDMERDLGAFVAHRIRRLQVTKKLITEIDDQPEPPPRPLPTTKPLIFKSVSPMPSVRSASPLVPSGSRSTSPLSVTASIASSRPSSPFIQLSQSRAASPLAVVRTPILRTSLPQPPIVAVPRMVVASGTSTTPTFTAVSAVCTTTSVTGSTTSTIMPAGGLTQTAILQTRPVQATASSQLLSSQPITVQIQQTEQGTRLMIPTGQLSQLPGMHGGFIHIVQTSSGQQMIATTHTSTPVQPVVPVQTATAVQLASVPLSVTCAATSFVQHTPPLPASPLVTAAANIGQAISVVSLSSVSPVSTAITTQAFASLRAAVKTTPTVNLPSSYALSSVSKPVMKVSPLATMASTSSTMLSMATTTTTISTVTTTTSIAKSTLVTTKAVPEMPKPSPLIVPSRSAPKLLPVRRGKPKTELTLEYLLKRQAEQRCEKLHRIARLNQHRCDMKPVYGQDLCDVINVRTKLCKHVTSIRGGRGNHWLSNGYVHCSNIQDNRIKDSNCSDNCVNSPPDYWSWTNSLRCLIRTPADYMNELTDTLDRYTFVIPPVVSPTITMHTSHPKPSSVMHETRVFHSVSEHLNKKSACLHKAASKMKVQFPELRLIQYDCGKLQTMDLLLRQLKSGSHRVLLFTQMTKMLDILEAFLNFHGHRYLRLDGTTHVEQRQVLMERFNADKRIFVFILSTRSGGIGVNLTGADTVIFYDSDWNPTMDAQAQDRCHRIGQTRDVHIYRLISERTIEENILKKANQKRLLGDLAIEGGSFTTAFLKQNTLNELFEEPSGLEALAKEKADQQKLRDDSRKQEAVEIASATTKPAAVSASDALVAPSPSLSAKVQQNMQAKFEEALCNAEDETDVVAAAKLKAEQKAELAEFDEAIPWDEKEAEIRREQDEVSKVEMDIANLEKELSPVERYAVSFIELQTEPCDEDEVKIAEEEIDQAKKDWELARLKTLKEEEERRAELEDDEMLFTYNMKDTSNKIFLSDVDGSHMPLWCPPTPPQDDNDVYLDQTMLFLYDPILMTETQLPPVYVRKERKKQKIETITTRKQRQRKEEQTRVPRSLFERPTATLLKMRKEAKLAKLKQGLVKPYRQVPPPAKPLIDIPAADQPEWLIHEDWALLQAVQTLLDMPLNLLLVSPAHTPNWDMVCDVVNVSSRVYRSPKQCKLRYENVIVPREEGRILYDINPRKQKKSKGIYKAVHFQTKNNRPMRTSQLYMQDNNNSLTMFHSLRFDSVRSIAAKRPPTLRPTLANPMQKNPKHAAVLQESEINYDNPLNPVEVAAIRAERIQREKKQSQAEQQLAAQRSQQAQHAAVTAAAQVTGVIATAAGATAVTQTVTMANPAAVLQGAKLQPIGTATTTTVLPTATLQKAVVGPGLTAVAITRPVGVSSNIIVNTSGSVAAAANSFAAINKRLTQAVTVTQPPIASIPVTGTLTSLASAVRAQRPATALTVQEIANQAQAQAQAQARAAAQLAAAKRALVGTSTTGVTTVQQQLTQAVAGKTLTQGQLSQLHQQTILKQQQSLQQRQFLQAQKLGLTQEQFRQQQLKRLQTQNAAQALVSGQKAVITSQLVTTVAQGGQKTTQLKQTAVPQALAADLQALLKQQQLSQKTVTRMASTGQLQQVTVSQAGQLTPAQIIAQAQVQHVGQSVAGAGQTPIATLVKTVSTPGGTVPSVTVPVSQVTGPVNINVSLPTGQKTAAAVAKATVSQLQQQQLKQLQLQHQLQQRKAQLQQAAKITTLSGAQVQQVAAAAAAAGKTQVPLIIHQQKPLPVTVQQIQQLVKQQAAAAAAQQQGATIQQIITSVQPGQMGAGQSTSAQPTIIATVTQGQGQNQAVITKVTLATAIPSTHIQTLTQATPGTLTLAQIAPPQVTHLQKATTVVEGTLSHGSAAVVSGMVNFSPSAVASPATVSASGPATISLSNLTGAIPASSIGGTQILQVTRPIPASVSTGITSRPTLLTSSTTTIPASSIIDSSGTTIQVQAFPSLASLTPQAAKLTSIGHTMITQPAGHHQPQQQQQHHHPTAHTVTIGQLAASQTLPVLNRTEPPVTLATPGNNTLITSIPSGSIGMTTPVTIATGLTAATGTHSIVPAVTAATVVPTPTLFVTMAADGAVSASPITLTGISSQTGLSSPVAPPITSGSVLVDSGVTSHQGSTVVVVPPTSTSLTIQSTQQQQQQQQQQGQSSKSTPYTMRLRNPPKY